MKKSSWTRHARQRAAQRAIPEFHLELLKAFGEAREQKGGTMVLRFSDSDRSWLRRQLEDAVAHWDQRQDAYAVIDAEGHVITVAHAMAKSSKNSRRRHRLPSSRQAAA